ncbi:MAG TPA: chromate transporter [Alphaproteobacteria bacterium]|jgi:chromate transporter
MDNRLIGLILVFAPLSLVSFGGGQAIVADIQHQTVDVHSWLSNQEFADLFAIARAAPGPSTMIVALLGWHVAGFWGALVATIAIFLPSSLVMYFGASWWQRNEGTSWRLAIERGLTPVAVGLLFAGAVAVMRAMHIDYIGIAIAAACAGLIYFTKLNAYLLIVGVAALYAALYFLHVVPLSI